MTGFKYIRTEIINKTMDELALELDVSKQAVYTWESGRKKIPEKRAKQLSDWIGIPERYFYIEELTERDKLEIRHYRLNKEVEETTVEYEEEMQDSQGNWVTVTNTHVNYALLEILEHQNMQLKIDDTLKKVNDVIYSTETEEEEVSSLFDIVADLDKKRSMFDRFADIIDGNKQTEFLLQVIKAMELFFDDDVKQRYLWDENTIPSVDLVKNEATLVQKLFGVFVEHKKQTDEAIVKKIQELKELGMLDDSSN